MTLVYLVLILTVFFIVWKLLTKNHDYFLKRGIPFSKPYPIFGNFLPGIILRKAKPDWLLFMSRKFRPNKVYGIFHFLQPVYVIEDPDIVKQISIKDFLAFPNHIPPVCCKGDVIFSSATIALEDQKWKDMRAILSPAFTGSKIRAIFSTVNDSVLDFVNYCTDQCDGNGCFEINAVKLFERHSVDTIFLATSGLKIDSVRNPNEQVFVNAKKPRDTDCLLQQMKFYATMFAPNLMKFLNIAYTPSEVTSFFEKIIGDVTVQRKATKTIRPDLVQQLIQAIDTQIANNEKPYSNMDVAAQSLDSLIACLETNAISLAFTCHELATNPKIQEKLYAEVSEMQAGLNGAPITFELLHKMEYLDAIVSESLRKHSPSIVQDRICVETTKVTDTDGKIYVIEKGMPIWINVFGLHHSSEYFPNPDKFDPERFMGENKLKILPNTYIPFSLGPRSCVGMRLAMLHLKLHLYQLVSQFSIEMSNKTPKRLSYAAIFLLTPAEDVYVVLKKRQQ